VVTFKHVNPPIDAQAVDEFERYLGMSLPEDYRRFLLEHNGGQPTPADFLISAAKGWDTVDYFLGLKAEEIILSLEEAAKHRKDHLPSNMISIGYDPGHSIICLSIQGADVGNIYFWDADFEVVGAPDYSNLHQLADSFDEFLSKLYE
jgi:hypothetical protein